jgi:N-carbamoyl-L-amino-acid hydrolase
LSGTLSSDAARNLKDKDGISVEDVRRDVGLSGSLDDVKLPSGYYKAFVELHIEQGPLLERERLPLGVVERIAAPASLRITVEGAGGHAGGVLMPDRRDALCAAAELILALEHTAKSSGAIDTVATVGICDVFPGAVNSIPACVKLSVDVRDTDLSRRDGVLRTLDVACRATAAKRQVAIHSELLNADAPAESGAAILVALAKACNKHGFQSMPMTSRAYHDSLFISRIAPVAMLFIPCRNGYSHRPDEFASPEDIARGTLVLAEALSSLSV